MLGSRPRGRPKDTICGAARRASCGVRARRRLGGCSRAPRRFTAQTAESLQSRTHRALLDLYALDTRFHAAQSRLRRCKRRRTAARARDTPAQGLSSPRHYAHVSQQQLGVNLRTLYKQDDVERARGRLGAQNLDEAVTKLDALSSVADSSLKVVRITSAAQRRLGRLSRSLTAPGTLAAADVPTRGGRRRTLAAARGASPARIVSFNAQAAAAEDVHRCAALKVASDARRPSAVERR